MTAPTDQQFNFHFSQIEINQSFPDISQLEEFASNESDFNCASQLVDIDLIDYCDISIDKNQDYNATLMDSYFRHKSSSLENLHFSQVSKPITGIGKEFVNDFTAQNSLVQHENSNIVPSTKSISVHFTIARYSKFDFDFITLRNTNNYSSVLVYIDFLIDLKLKHYLFKVQKEQLTLFPKLNHRDKLAYLIPYESGKYLIRCCLSMFKNRKTVSHLIYCHLNVIELTIFRPFSTNEVDLNCFESTETEQHDFFFPMSKLTLERCFVLKVCLETPHPLVTFASVCENICSKNVKFHYVNPWTCLLCFARPNGFTLKFEIAKQINNQSMSQLLSFYICDSINGKRCFLLDKFRININFYQSNELQHSCIQAHFTDGSNQITLSKWKQVDFRNKDQLKRIKVNIGLSLGGKKVAYSHWKCTQCQFIIEPLAKKTVFVCINKFLLEDANKSQNGTLPNIALLVEQFGGKGKVVSSVAHLTVIE